VLYPGSFGRCIATPWRSAGAPAGQQPPGPVPAGVRARDEDRRPAVGRQAVTRVDQQAEQALGAGTGRTAPNLM